MKMSKTIKLVVAGALALSLFAPGSQAQALTLPDPFTNAYLYGDFHSYSLPILAYQYDQLFGGGTGPSNPFYVQSAPGQISDDIVIATGSSGNPVTTNFTGMDNAYPTPNSSGIPTFSTGTTTDPDPTFTGDQAGTWDAQLSALTAFLDGNDMIVLFNNNQENSGAASNQNLYAWGQVAIRDSEGGAAPLYFDFTNSPPGGTFGGDPTGYTSPGLWAPTAADYVLSGGQVCINAGGSPVGCDTAGAIGPFNHNLGADQAAYALISLELNEFLSNWTMESLYDVMSVDIRMYDLNNGYEQIFVQFGTVGEFPPAPIPEPSTLVLLGAGILGVALLRRKAGRQ